MVGHFSRLRGWVYRTWRTIGAKARWLMLAAFLALLAACYVTNGSITIAGRTITVRVEPQVTPTPAPPLHVETLEQTLDVHLTYTVGSTLWTGTEIQDAYDRVNEAIGYWNTQPLPAKLRIVDLPVIAAGLDAMNFDQAWQATDSLGRARVTVYLVRQPTWWVYGYSRRGNYATLAYPVMTGVAAHEIGHVLGGLDHSYWEQTRGWTCATDPDVMCRSTLTPTLAWQTIWEIDQFTVQPW